MPPEERSTKTGERCELHPQSPSVARCESCGRTLCVVCAVPVRGRVLGPECLAEVLGRDAPIPLATSPGTGRGLLLVTLAFALAVVATALPWTRFQQGSGPFGAWGLSLRWSVVAAGAATLGLLACLIAWRRGAGRLWRGMLRALAATVLAASALAIARPPAFAPAWLGPWVALAGGAAAIGATFAPGGRPASRRRYPRVVDST